MTHCRRIMLEELQRRNFSPTTIRSYLYAVERFARHFKCRPDRLNHTHLRSYQAHLLRTGQLQPKTVRLHVSALRFFFVKTLRRRYLLDDTPYPKAPQRLPSILSVEEMARLIEAADGLYHRTMVMMLYSTGMRSAELLQLQVADIDSRRMLIHIRHGKGGRDRYVPLSPTLLATLRVYYRWMRPQDVAVSRHRPQLARRQTDHEARALGRGGARGDARRFPQTRQSPSDSPFLRDPSPRKWRRPAHDSAAPGARQHPAHGAVSASLAETPTGRRESTGCAHDLRA